MFYIVFLSEKTFDNFQYSFFLFSLPSFFSFHMIIFSTILSSYSFRNRLLVPILNSFCFLLTFKFLTYDDFIIFFSTDTTALFFLFLFFFSFPHFLLFILCRILYFFILFKIAYPLTISVF